MNTGVKLAAFAVVVAASFGSALAAGAAFGPISVDGSDDDDHDMDMDMPADEQEAEVPRGLSVAASGHRLVVDDNEFDIEAPSSFGFRIVDDAGEAVVDFEELHERPLHLIVLSRNFVDYLHLHPTMDTTGHWTVDLPALAPGSYRVFADFQPFGGENLTLGADVTVAGDVGAVELPTPDRVDTVDGFDVTLAGDPTVGDSELTFTVSRNGEHVRTDPYLGAAGHLVAIREGDLAYLHVHPHEVASDAAVTFTGEFPSAGTYRLFFDFSHNDAVHTAAYTVVVAPDASDEQADHDSESSAQHDEGH